MNIVELIVRQARSRPDSPAIVDGDRTILYRELAERILRTATHFARLGIVPGDRVGVCLKDSWEHIVIMFALGRMGAVAVPIDWRSPAREKARVVEALAIKLVVIEPREQWEGSYPSVMVDAAWRVAVDRAEIATDLPENPNAPYVISSSSGTTGAPKFVIVSHLQYFYSLIISRELEALPRPCRLLSTLPLHFSWGRRKYNNHLIRGDCLILHPALFAADEYVELVTRHRATIGSITPTVLRQLIALSDGTRPLLPGLVALTCGGAPLSAEDKIEAVRKVTPNLYNSYSASAIGVITLLHPSELMERPESAGRAHPLTRVEIVDEDDRPVENGGIGRVRCQSPAVGSGISGPSGWESADEGFRDGWYYPGDLAMLDAQGFLFVKGRAKELIIRGAAKIYPAEVESVLNEHEDVAEAAVIGQRTDRGDSAVVAFVVARRAVEAGVLIAHCRVRLDYYKVPREIRFVAGLPKTTAGKVNKAALAAALGEPTARLA